MSQFGVDMNLKEQLLQHAKVQVKSVKVVFDDAEIEVNVKQFSAREYQEHVAFTKSLVKKDGDKDVVDYSRLRESNAHEISKRLLNETGTSLFTLDEVLDLSDEAVDKFMTAIKSTEKTVEQAAKN